MNHEQLVKILIEAGRAVRTKVSESLKSGNDESLRSVHAERADDTIYQIDRDVEDVLPVPGVVDAVDREIERQVRLRRRVIRHGSMLLRPRACRTLRGARSECANIAPMRAARRLVRGARAARSRRAGLS